MMSANAAVVRALSSKCMTFRTNGGAFSFSRRLSRYNAHMINFRVSSYSTTKFYIHAVPCRSPSQTKFKNNSSYDCGWSQICFSKCFSTQPSPKPSGTTLGLADQVNYWSLFKIPWRLWLWPSQQTPDWIEFFIDKVLRTSTVEKEAEKPPESSEEEAKKDKEKQVRAVKITLLAFGGMFVGTALYIFFSYGKHFETVI